MINILNKIRISNVTLQTHPKQFVPFLSQKFKFPAQSIYPLAYYPLTKFSVHFHVSIKVSKGKRVLYPYPERKQRKSHAASLDFVLSIQPPTQSTHSISRTKVTSRNKPLSR